MIQTQDLFIYFIYFFASTTIRSLFVTYLHYNPPSRLPIDGDVKKYSGIGHDGKKKSICISSWSPNDSYKMPQLYGKQDACENGIYRSSQQPFFQLEPMKPWNRWMTCALSNQRRRAWINYRSVRTQSSDGERLIDILIAPLEEVDITLLRSIQWATRE